MSNPRSAYLGCRAPIVVTRWAAGTVSVPSKIACRASPGIVRFFPSRMYSFLWRRRQGGVRFPRSWSRVFLPWAPVPLDLPIQKATLGLLTQGLRCSAGSSYSAGYVGACAHSQRRFALPAPHCAVDGFWKTCTAFMLLPGCGSWLGSAVGCGCFHRYLGSVTSHSCFRVVA